MATRPLVRSLLAVTRSRASLARGTRTSSFASFGSPVGGLRTASSFTSTHPSTYLDFDGALFGASGKQAALDGRECPPESVAILNSFLDGQGMNAAGAEGCEIYTPSPEVASTIDGAWYIPNQEAEGPKLERLTLVLSTVRGEMMLWHRRSDQTVSEWVHVPRDSAEWPEDGEYTIAGAVQLQSDSPEGSGEQGKSWVYVD